MFGHAYDMVITRIRHYGDTHAEHNLYVWYAKRVVVVRRTVKLKLSFPHLRLLWLVFLLRDDSQKISWTYGSCLRGNELKYHDLSDKCISRIQTKLASLDSQALQSLETPAMNFTCLS